ncbi:MAG: hypothetical protein ACYS5F_14590 [Planctomycetota bacterium]|jgi:hypothetical protein
MANVTNRVTKQYLVSVNTPDFPPAEWIINSPEADALYALHLSDPLGRHDSRYWNINGDLITEMSVVEKDAVDQAVLDQNAADAKTDAVTLFDTPASEGEHVGLEMRSEARERNEDYNELKQKIVFLENVLAALLTNGGFSASKTAALNEAAAMGLDPRSIPQGDWPTIDTGGLPQSANAILHFPRNRDGTSPDKVRTPSENRNDLRNRINSGSEDI